VRNPRIIRITWLTRLFCVLNLFRPRCARCGQRLYKYAICWHIRLLKPFYNTRREGTFRMEDMMRIKNIARSIDERWK